MDERPWSTMSPETTYQKNWQRTGGDFGAPHCSLLSVPIQWLLEPPTGFELWGWNSFHTCYQSQLRISHFRRVAGVVAIS